jgi:hypothetical protein
MISEIKQFILRHPLLLSLISVAGLIFVVAFYLNFRNSAMTQEQLHRFIRSDDFISLPREKKREYFDRAMDLQVSGYLATPVQDRDKYLDKIIDEMKNFQPPKMDRRPPGPDPNMPRQRPTAEQMRARREMRDPVKEASRREFMGALRMRSQQRGIQIGPSGGGGGPGGPGGGAPPF